MEKLFNPQETASMLQISVQTLRDWAKKHKIEYVKIGGRYKFQKSTIDRILTPHNVKIEP